MPGTGDVTCATALDDDTVVLGGNGSLQYCEVQPLLGGRRSPLGLFVACHIIEKGSTPFAGPCSNLAFDTRLFTLYAGFANEPSNVHIGKLANPNNPASARFERVTVPSRVNLFLFDQDQGTLLLGTSTGLSEIRPGSDRAEPVNVQVLTPPYNVTALAKKRQVVLLGGEKDRQPFVHTSRAGGRTWGPGSAIPVIAGGSGPYVTATSFVVNACSNQFDLSCFGFDPSARAPLAAAVGPSIFAGTAAGMFRSTDLGQSWGRVQGVRTATVMRVLVTPERLYAGTFRNANAVYRSSDVGRTWHPGDARLVGQVARAIAALGDDVVASGEISIFRSTDRGATWTSSGQGLPASLNVDVLATDGNLVVATVATTSARGVYRSTDGGLTWSQGAVFPQGTPAALAFAGGNLYAGLTGTASEHLLKSTDGGLSFTPSGSGLANRRVLSLASSDSRTLFAGTSAGLFFSTDGGASWAEYTPKLRGIPVSSLAATAERVYAGTTGASLWSFALPPRVHRLLPIVLDVSTGATRFTTELALTNASARPIDLRLRYTASIGSGSGSATDRLAAGEQRIVPDAIAYLRGKGVPIPPEGSQGGTLLVSFDGHVAPESVAVTARTGAATVDPQPVGKAGLAYAGIDPVRSSAFSVTVYGLREGETDRSNFAVFSTSDEPVTLQVTAFDGSTPGAGVVIAEAETLPPYGWKQYNRILGLAGFANGYVTVRRTSATGAFSCYGVINDNGTNDGSFLEPTEGFVVPYLHVPVLVETPAFVSELVLANGSGSPARLTLAYQESLAGVGGGAFTMELAAGAQLIVANAIDFLRSRGVPLGPRGAGSYAGSLRVAVEGAPIEKVWAGARTASLSAAAGQFGLFTPAVFGGGESTGAAALYGLQSNADNRSNVAVIHTGTSAAAGPITLSLQAHDGDFAGAPAGEPEVLTLQPGQWRQLGNFLAGKGVANGWVTLTRTAGTAPWIAYGVINDGGSPGQRTGDGAYVPMTR